MKIRWQLMFLFGVLFVALGGLVFMVLRQKPLLLLASELLLLGILVLFVFLIFRITRPLNQMALGLDAIKDQDFSGYLRTSGSGEIDKLVVVYNQMMDKIRSERMYQQEQHYFLQSLVSKLPVGLLILDYDENLKEFNPEAKRILGLTLDHLGKNLSHTILGEDVLHQSTALVRLGGSRHLRIYSDQFKHRGFYQKFVIVEEAGEEIRKVERESYGKVIRMMAHEVKNSVGAINSILESLVHAEGVSHEEKKDYLTIVISRNKSLNTFMDNFAKVVRLPYPEKLKVDLNQMLLSVYHLMKVKHETAGVHLSIELPKETVEIMGNREQLEQAFINIVLNAFEAQSTQIRFQLQKNRVKITDNGTGISASVQDMLFTPFFSTKPTGQGVGLTMVREILNNHGFDFSLSSKEGETSFEMEF